MEEKCPVCTVMDFMGKKWSLLLLVELYKGKVKWKRYSELKGVLPGITPKVLSMRLKELVREKLVLHKVDAREFPAKSKYALSKSGEDFMKIIKGIKRWGLKWKVKNEHCESMGCKECDM